MLLLCLLLTILSFVAVDPKKCYATGRGIQPRGVRVGDLADIKVHTEGAGEGQVTGSLVGPGRQSGTTHDLNMRKC